MEIVQNRQAATLLPIIQNQTSIDAFYNIMQHIAQQYPV